MSHRPARPLRLADDAAPPAGARQDVVERTAARVVLLDERGRTLLFRGGDPARPDLGTWWFTPGGGVDPGEDLAAAARRELREETGVVAADVGRVRATRVCGFSFEGRWYRQQESFFVVRAPAADVHVDRSAWTEVERRSVVDHRWWTAAELQRTGDVVHPSDLLDLLRAVG
ncbi:NUDIX hydrolase [Thalassiella azotivora]